MMNLMKFGVYIVSYLILSSMVIFSVTSTYALFFEAFQGTIQVCAASAENTIKRVDIITQKNNGLEVEIKRNTSKGYRPQISFDIKGELAKYIQSIDRIMVNKNGNFPLSIKINMATIQDLKQLKSSNKENLSGTLNIRDFNGKKLTSKSINMSIDYLLNQHDNVSSDSALKKEND